MLLPQLKPCFDALKRRAPVLTARYDSLLVQCGIGAGIYYAPYDAAFVAGAYIRERWIGKRASPKVDAGVAPDRAYDAFLIQKGLGKKDVQVTKARKNFWRVETA